MTSPLGNTTKTASQRLADARVNRFRLQAEARKLTSSNDRVQGCLRWPTGGVNGRVAVKYRRKASYAYYGGLLTCGQIWKCPVCAAKITERRRELWARALGGKLVHSEESESGYEVKSISHNFQLAMGTFTVQHSINDRLIDVIGLLEDAYRRTWSGRWAVEYKQSAEVIGTIRALEITKGDNGWHPHIHTVIVTTGEAMRYHRDDMRDELKLRWLYAVGKAGGMASYENGCDLRVADVFAMEYIDKLGMPVIYHAQDMGSITEVTKYPTKKAHEVSQTLFGLLGLSALGDIRASKAWQLAQAVLKGRRHIMPSKGLLRLLGGSVELTDDHLAATDLHQSGDEVLALLERPQWDIIDIKGLRADLLNVAQAGDRELVHDFLVEVGAI